uniref:Uncharacterized protein n=1 Tax=Setaria italica TaxID=4555 RepID=K3ZBL7_SETIT
MVAFISLPSILADGTVPDVLTSAVVLCFVSVIGGHPWLPKTVCVFLFNCCYYAMQPEKALYF